MADDLNKPLGQGPKKRRLQLPVTFPQVMAGILMTSLGTFAVWAMVANDPLGGEPVVVVASDLRAETKQPVPAEATARRYDGPPADSIKVVAAPSTPGSPAAANLPPGATRIGIIDGSTGKRQEVVVPNTAHGPPPRAATEPRAPGDPRFAEMARHGPIPRIAPDGTRPLEAFAQQVIPLSGKPDAPRVAIVVGGLGVGAGRTNDAITKLPPAVTLAFAPYGSELERQVGQARAQAHEVLLQVPMEPNDYPDNDPGPQTLLTTLDPGINLDRLHWSMSRFQGYLGLANYMGGRFIGSEHAFAPVLKEAAKRGLMYFDDGTAPRSLAGQIAGANKLPFAKADLSIDTLPTSTDIDRALGRLESIARQRGTAVGTATALPISIDRIAKWAKAVEGRGILLVPISAIANKAAKSS